MATSYIIPACVLLVWQICTPSHIVSTTRVTFSWFVATVRSSLVGEKIWAFLCSCVSGCLLQLGHAYVDSCFVRSINHRYALVDISKGLWDQHLAFVAAKMINDT